MALLNSLRQLAHQRTRTLPTPLRWVGVAVGATNDTCTKHTRTHSPRDLLALRTAVCSTLPCSLCTTSGALCWSVCHSVRRPSSQSCRDSNVSNLTTVWCWCVYMCVCVCAFRKEGWFFSYSHQTMKTCVLSLPRRPMWWERTLNRRTRQLQKLPLVDRLWKKPSSSFVT